MARDNDITRIPARAAAASAGTTQTYSQTLNRPAIFQGWAWTYESTEANADNTLDFAIAYTTDGTNFTTLFANANPNGLLNTSDPLVSNVNKGDAGSSGGAATSVTPTEARIPAGAVIRTTIVTAGTGTIPAVSVDTQVIYV